jgi:histone H3/H4
VLPERPEKNIFCLVSPSATATVYFRETKKMSTGASAGEERDLRAALQHAVAQVCLEEEMSDSSSAHMSAQAVAALSELVYQYATTCLSYDLVAFSKHANRRTITLEDVLLMARKDPKLQEKLQAFVKRQEQSGKEKSAKKTTNKASTSPAITQRMKEMQSRLGKGIDSSSDDDDGVQMIEDPFGKENQKQPAKRKSSKQDDDPFASSDEDQATSVKPLAKRPFLPGGTKTGMSSDESDEDEMTF